MGLRPRVPLARPRLPELHLGYSLRSLYAQVKNNTRRWVCRERGTGLAIYHFACKVMSRNAKDLDGKPVQVVRAASYRAGEKLRFELTGRTFHYKKPERVWGQIFAPDHAPQWVHDRATLWNAVERKALNKDGSLQKDARLAREYEFALPACLTLAQQTALVSRFLTDEIVALGMVADANLHDAGEGNPHVHVMCTVRDITPDGFAKPNADWNKKELLFRLRKAWADYANHALEEAGSLERIDHRSLKDQGIEATPTEHEGRSIEALERKARNTRRMELREAKHEIARIQAEEAAIHAQIRELEQQAADAAAQPIVLPGPLDPRLPEALRLARRDRRNPREDRRTADRPGGRRQWDDIRRDVVADQARPRVRRETLDRIGAQDMRKLMRSLYAYRERLAQQLELEGFGPGRQAFVHSGFAQAVFPGSATSTAPQDDEEFKRRCVLWKNTDRKYTKAQYDQDRKHGNAAAWWMHEFITLGATAKDGGFVKHVPREFVATVAQYIGQEAEAGRWVLSAPATVHTARAEPAVQRAKAPPQGPAPSPPSAPSPTIHDLETAQRMAVERAGPAGPVVRPDDPNRVRDLDEVVIGGPKPPWGG